MQDSWKTFTPPPSCKWRDGITGSYRIKQCWTWEVLSFGYQLKVRFIHLDIGDMLISIASPDIEKDIEIEHWSLTASSKWHSSLLSLDDFLFIHLWMQNESWFNERRMQLIRTLNLNDSFCGSPRTGPFSSLRGFKTGNINVVVWVRCRRDDWRWMTWTYGVVEASLRAGMERSRKCSCPNYGRVMCAA